jgi:hypothetical protein
MAQINKPNQYFNTVIYTGNETARTIDVGFQPDLVWGKNRGGTGNHWWWDSIRGANEFIRSNTTDSEQSASNQDLTGFVSNGFTLGTGTRMNPSSTMASWNWLASNTTASNTDGSISSTVSANTTSGFSIVSYTSNGSASQTVGHGLGVVPNVIISKNRTDGTATYGNWIVYHSSLANANDTKILLNSTAASSTTNEWGDTDPTTTVYSLHTSGDGATNHSTDQIVAYCFAEKKGFSKFGSYTGNGSTDGTFVYTGFKPAFVILKASSVAGQNWMMFDNKRNEFNVMNKKLYADNALAEETSDYLDFTSNGYKLKTISSDGNGSGTTYIYMAFAENPLVGTNNIPATAR